MEEFEKFEIELRVLYDDYIKNHMKLMARQIVTVTCLIDRDLNDDDDNNILDSVGGAEIENIDLKVGQEKRIVSTLDHSDEDF